MRENAGGPLASWIIVIPVVTGIAVALVLAGGPRNLGYIVDDSVSQAFAAVSDWIAAWW